MSYVSKLNNNKTLLIAMGDSWTEGVGCYVPELLTDFHNQKIDIHQLHLESYRSGCYAKGSWPAVLASMIPVDVINIGVGGAANSGCAKRLIQEYSSQILNTAKKYDRVTVLWLLTSPDRFSFYHNKAISNFNPSYMTDGLTQEYIKLLGANYQDSLLETSFYLRCVDWFCKANGFNFLYGSAFVDIQPLSDILSLQGNIHDTLTEPCISRYLDAMGPSVYAHCGHPNEKGYKIIAEVLSKVISIT